MSKIQVPPEVLIQVAEKFRLESIQMEWRVSSLNHHMDTMLMWEGTTRQRFFEDFHKARSEMTKTIEHMRSISDELKRIAYKFILVDEELLPLALVGGKEEPKEWFEEAWDSLKGLGNDFVEASNERYDKRYSSVGSFLDYWTAGIPKGAYHGYVDRADKLFDSPNDFANGMTFGVHGTIRETVFPTNAWSTEHMASMIGAAGLVTGGALVKPKDLLRPSVKNEVGNGKKGLKHESGGDGGGVAKAEGPGDAKVYDTVANDSYAYWEYKKELMKDDIISNSEKIINGAEFWDQKAVNILTKNGSDINDWWKMESTYSYSTDFGEGKIHYYQNAKTGEISSFDSKLKVPKPKNLRTDSKDLFWIIDLDENFVPTKMR